MGPVVTINSSTLINKGLELIEAHLLFDVEPEHIVATVHPQSIVHSMVTWRDGATTLQASPPDMRLPIALGLTWPERLDDVEAPLTWGSPSQWTFEPVDNETFPAINLARFAVGASATHLRCSTPRTRSWWMPSSTVLCRGWRLLTRCRLSFMSTRVSPTRRWRIFWLHRVGPFSAHANISAPASGRISERGFDYGYRRHHHRYFGVGGSP